MKDQIYAEEIASLVIGRSAVLPIEGAPVGLDLALVTHLVSVLGFSWQPVVLMAARVRPDWVLLLGTEASVSGRSVGLTPREFLTHFAGIREDRVRVVAVDDPLETAVYRAVWDFTDGIAGAQVVVDPTGGKKSMSAAAALAGYLAGVPLMYVDYHSYEGSIPTPGSEYPRYLANPLEVFGDLELERVRRAFDQGAFVDARLRAEWLVDRLADSSEATLLATLAAAYGAWDAFDVARARRFLAGAVASDVLTAVVGDGAARRIRAHELFLRRLQGGDAAVHAAVLFSAAERHRDDGSWPEALSLYWATVEFVLTDRLQRVYGIDTSTSSQREVARALAKAGRADLRVRSESGRLTAREALRVLVALDSPEEGEIIGQQLDRLREYRNRSPFAHGSRTSFDPARLGALRRAARVALATWVEGFDDLVDELQFPILDTRRGAKPGAR